MVKEPINCENMKKLFFYFVLFTLGLLGFPAVSQTNSEPEALGLPGDNLNLYAVLDVFQKSKTLEEFEKSINDKETNINNLDLDNDQQTDYIRVLSEKEGKSHYIVLQVPVNSNENQDVAVISVNTSKEGNVRVQVIGDEELYGKDYVVEPSSEATRGTVNPGYDDNDKTVIINNNTTTTTNNYASSSNNDALFAANAWAIVIHLFSPRYVVYRSPWYWGYYPSYWRPWRPVFYYDYWGYHRRFYNNYYYRRCSHIRYPAFYSHYTARRSRSLYVNQNRVNGIYRTTYQGRDYKKPIAPPRPTPRPNRPVNRPVTPTNRPTVPVTRPRPTTPVARPEPTVPVTRPATRPVSRPATRPVSRPVTRPAATPSRPMPRGQRVR